MTAAGLDLERLGLAFKSRPDIVAGIQKAADSTSRVTLFNDIANYVVEQLSANADEPALKRRRVDIGSVNTNGTSESGKGVNGGVSAADAANDPVLLEVKDISLSIPQRKKYDLCFTKRFLYARTPGATAPVQGIVYAWKDFEYAFYLPVPEKSQVQYNYILFPRNTAMVSASKTSSPPDIEPLVFTVPATAPKPGTILGPSASAAAAVSDTYSSLLHWAIDSHLRGAGSKCSIVSSDPKVFHSAVRQSYRPNEKAVHIKAFRGSKDGYLFFLPTGILWGFKKPLLFVPLESIVAVSYTSVLQRTFNIVMEVEIGDDKTEEIEFAMLDQEDYRGIDETYVRRHALQDRSMAEQRKAKKELAENARKKGDEAAAGGGEPDNGLTELQRAEQQMQDEEDEEEEDYDPGSDGESDGEGESSEEDEDGSGVEYDEGDEEDEEAEEGDDNET